MTISQNRLAQALVVLQGLPTASGWCLRNTRQALGAVGLRLPAPMPAPDNTAYANFVLLSQNPRAYGWMPIGLFDPVPIKLIYFKNVALLDNPPRYAGHIGLLSGGEIYSDSNYALSGWWISKFAGAFVPVPDGPRLIVALAGGTNPSVDGKTYEEIPSTWDDAANQIDVDVAALQTFLGTNVPGLPEALPVRQALQAIGFPNAEFNLTHIDDVQAPRVYAFV